MKTKILLLLLLLVFLTLLSCNLPGILDSKPAQYEGPTTADYDRPSNPPTEVPIPYVGPSSADYDRPQPELPAAPEQQNPQVYNASGTKTTYGFSESEACQVTVPIALYVKGDDTAMLNATGPNFVASY